MTLRLLLAIGMVGLLPLFPVAQTGIFISTGDNDFFGNSLPVDSKAAIDADFDLFKELGYKRIYWRGLETACWMEDNLIRKESCRYYALWKWYREIYNTGIDKYACEAAHKRGLEIWGVGNLGDWASQADAPPFWDYPYNNESRLRIDHPEWVPVDRQGVMRQGGMIEFAYPEARKAMIDLHMKIMDRDGYDGAMFFSYSENHSVRFQDEFGFNEPIVQEFKKRYGIDLRTHAFTRAASRADWVRLRGEYLTRFLREMKQQFKNRKLVAVIDPHDPYYTQPWNVPEIMQTGGPIYQDLETWVRDSIVDQLVVYGSCAGQLQNKSIDDALWLTRGTHTSVAALTSGGPGSERWKPFVQKGVSILNNFNEEEMFLDRSIIPEQPLSSLKSDKPVLRMRVLSQIIYGKATATVAALLPLVNDKNPLIRRMTLKALGQTNDPKVIPILEKGLDDPENCVRSIAAYALGINHGPKSHLKLLSAIEKHGNHAFDEMALAALIKCAPGIKADLLNACRTSPSDLVRRESHRAIQKWLTEEDIPLLVAALNDKDQFTRFTAAQSLGYIRNSPEAAKELIKATRHEDPVVSDRAATSLAEVINRKETVLNDLRPQILEALRSLYGKLGEGCTRVDAEWGYRPVGNALLALGLEGEKVLGQFMNQTTDRKLAESAWKSLYIRQRPNSFSEVTEKENTAAFKMRPAFLNATTKK